MCVCAQVWAHKCLADIGDLSKYVSCDVYSRILSHIPDTRIWQGYRVTSYPLGWVLGTKSEKNSVDKDGRSRGGQLEPMCTAGGKIKWDSSRGKELL